ncbi:unnamed protein product, partial [Chrysoparadoxa australica]
VFITKIFLRILESENTTHDHKALVLDVVCTICESPQMLAEIFLNYDCDAQAIDLYNRIVNALSKASAMFLLSSRGSIPPEQQGSSAVREEHQLRLRGLEGLVSILMSLLQASAGDYGEGDQVSHHSADGSAGGITSREGSSHPPTNGVDEEGGQPSAVHAYGKKKRMQEDLESGIVRFNLHPSRGIAALIESGLIEGSPAAVAAFLWRQREKLDKTQIGEYLGKEKEYNGGFCWKVLHEYVTNLDFTNMRFEAALRLYLSGFRLPGEAQKIDRMMEKFAEHYCLLNSTVFPSADTAFILAFSVIMLNTDLHNPAIKEDRRMTKQGFIGNNRGIAGGSDLDESFLSELFDQIKMEPISLKEDDDLRARLQGTSTGFSPFPFGLGSTDRLKRAAFDKERQDMVKASEALFRRSSVRRRSHTPERTNSRKSLSPANEVSTRGVDETASAARAKAGNFLSFPDTGSESKAECVRAMFAVAWWPMLGAFSQVLEECGHIDRADQASEDPAAAEMDLINLCLTGMQFAKVAIRLSALCFEQGAPDGAVARETFVNGLTKFTLLDTVKPMQPKNVACIKALLTIALEDGNYLGVAWGSVLRSISQLARLNLFASGLHMDDVFFACEPAHEVHASSTRHPPTIDDLARRGKGLFQRGNTASEQARGVERSNAEAVREEVDPSLVDRVFSNSTNLSAPAVQEFLAQLCTVSLSEVDQAQSLPAATFVTKDIRAEARQPRVFSLQKLVEVADFNMDSRSRIMWSHEWELLGNHFATVGQHPNTQVALYAVDSLRQLAVKFMAKEELRDFNFQRMFMTPFEKVMSSSTSIEVREFVLTCLDNVTRARAKSIRSGWKTIFSV